MIKKSQKIVNSICLTGGEPSLYLEPVLKLIKKCKADNLKVKVDTNGNDPLFIRKIINAGVDFISMDLKTNPKLLKGKALNDWSNIFRILHRMDCRINTVAVFIS